MNRTSKALFIVLFLASVGRAQVVLPPSSDYNDPYNYYRDCVSNNGNESESLCEQQTGALFPVENPEPEFIQEESSQREEGVVDSALASNTGLE